VERVVLASAVTEGCLLDPAAGLFHGLQPEFDDVEGVEDGDGVLEFVADRVGVAPERVQWCDPDAGGEDLAAGVEPFGVDPPGPAGDEVQQACTCPELPVLIDLLGQVDHPGPLRRTLPRSWGVVPDVLVHTEDLNPEQPCRVVNEFLEQRGDGVSLGVPVHPEPSCDR